MTNQHICASHHEEDTKKEVDRKLFFRLLVKMGARRRVTMGRNVTMYIFHDTICALWVFSVGDVQWKKSYFIF